MQMGRTTHRSTHDRRTFFRGTGLVLSAAALGGGLAACSRTSTGGGGESGSDGGGGGDLLSRLQEAGTITVGFAGEAPYSFEEGGEVIGANCSQARHIDEATGGREGPARMR